MAQSKSKVVEGSMGDKFVARYMNHDGRGDGKTCYFKIANFKGLYAAAKSSAAKVLFRFPFTAGKGMGVPSNWEFQLKINKEGALAGELKHLGSDPFDSSYMLCLKNVKGEYDPVISSGSNFHTSYPNVSNANLSLSFRKFGTPEALQKGGFLSKDELQLKLSFTVISKETWMTASETQLKRDLSLDLKNMLYTGVGADVTFIFGEEEGSGNVKIKAHRAILICRSSVFASGMKEATDGKVKIEDMTPNAFGILLKFLYSGEVDEEWGSVASELIYAADKYELKVLQNYLSQNIRSALTASNVWKIRSLANLFKLPEILKSTMNFIKENTEIVDELILKRDRKLI